MGTKRTQDTGRVDSLGRRIKESEHQNLPATRSTELATSQAVMGEVVCAEGDEIYGVLDTLHDDSLEDDERTECITQAYGMLCRYSSNVMFKEPKGSEPREIYAFYEERDSE